MPPAQKGAGWKRRDAYDCHQHCLGPRGEPGRRARWHCALLDFPEEQWEPLGEHPTYWLGGEPSEPAIDRRAESHNDGCPGAWARCEWIRSLVPYFRHRAQGVWSENIRLSRCEDPLVLEAVEYWEAQVIRADGHFWEIQA